MRSMWSGDPCHLEKLHISVKEVTLGDVDLLGAELVHEAQHARGEDGLAAGGRAGKGALRRRVLKHDAVQLRHVQLRHSPRLRPALWRCTSPEVYGQIQVDHIAGF